MNLRRLILKLAYPINYHLGKLSLKRKIGDSFYFDARRVLQQGDILLSYRNYEPSNILISGKYTHSAMYYQDIYGREYVVEAVGEGVIRKSLPKFLFSKDKICILRAKEVSESDRSDASKVARSFIGTPYDYYFENSINAFYCSELIHYSLKQVSNEYSYQPGHTLGMETVTPMDFYEASQFEHILESR